ncbi:unnamed protein product [Dovyalis caffra]|uniref:Uncharacterized protein n=1 Tax=Dovyalis caffra TaxID=77055 RepID=A0AAV1S3V3_9ROSI|nr:unnamed protein product [Dovyalis caffra]
MFCPNRWIRWILSDVNQLKLNTDGSARDPFCAGGVVVSFQLRNDSTSIPAKLIDSFHKNGDAGDRTLYLSHAKRALYHLSYIPFRYLWLYYLYKDNKDSIEMGFEEP